MPNSGFREIVASGSDREMGRQHGAQCREQLAGFLDYLARTLALSRSQLRDRAGRFLPLFERHVPGYAEEVRGLAEGAKVDLLDALAVQIRGELANVPDGACTTFVISGRGTRDGQTLIGQNSDMDPEIEDLSYVLRLKPSDRPPLLMWTFGGQIGYHGFNQSGVAHFANSLGGGPKWRFALPHYPLKRRMLEQCTVAQVLQLLRKQPVCSSGNYVLCDGLDHIADVELTPEGFELIEDQGRGFIAHANHFLCGANACAANHASSLADSFPRQERMQRLVAERFGSLTVDDLKKFLADHDGHPTSICRHPHSGPDHPSVSARGRTAASLIAEPRAGRLHACKGNPCEHAYFTYSLD